MSSMISDNMMDAVKIALDGLSTREQMISRNIANVDTPGYQAQDVNFEQVVQQALKKASQPALTVTNASHIQPGTSASSSVYSLANRPGGSERVDGNNVDIDTELAQMNETVLRYQALTQMISQKFSLIKSLTVSR